MLWNCFILGNLRWVKTALKYRTPGSTTKRNVTICLKKKKRKKKRDTFWRNRSIVLPLPSSYNISSYIITSVTIEPGIKEPKFHHPKISTQKSNSSSETRGSSFILKVYIWRFFYVFIGKESNTNHNRRNCFWDKFKKVW